MTRAFIVYVGVLVFGLVAGCGRTHGASASSRAGASAEVPDATLAGSYAAAGSGRAGAGSVASAAGSGRAGAGSVTAGAGSVAVDVAGSAGRQAAGSAGSAAISGATGSAGSATTGAAGAAGSSAIPANVPQLPEGIDLEDGAPLPEGLWVGETRFEDSCAQDGSGVVPGSSRQVTLQVTRAARGATHAGLIVFGDHQNVPPPVTDPALGYPLAANYDDILCREYHASAGYPYVVRDGHVSPDGRFVFRASVVELYTDWCARQTSYLTGQFALTQSSYSCLPPAAAMKVNLCQSTPASCPISGGLLNICLSDSICLCFEDGCYVNLNRAYRFDLRVSGDSLTGFLTRPGMNDTTPGLEIKFHRVH